MRLLSIAIEELRLIQNIVKCTFGDYFKRGKVYRRECIPVNLLLERDNTISELYVPTNDGMEPVNVL